MELDCRTALILRHPDGKQVLLLKRSPLKKLLPNLITGIGGKAEFELGDGANLEKSGLREFVEETKIDVNIISGMQLKLSTIISRGNLQVVLFWFTGQLKEAPKDLSCNEGDLKFYKIDAMPLKEFTAAARKAIPFILSRDDDKVYNGVFADDGELLVN